jgi:hypothetical protein
LVTYEDDESASGGEALYNYPDELRNDDKNKKRENSPNLNASIVDPPPKLRATQETKANLSARSSSQSNRNGASSSSAVAANAQQNDQNIQPPNRRNSVEPPNIPQQERIIPLRPSLLNAAIANMDRRMDIPPPRPLVEIRPEPQIRFNEQREQIPALQRPNGNAANYIIDAATMRRNLERANAALRAGNVGDTRILQYADIIENFSIVINFHDYPARNFINEDYINMESFFRSLVSMMSPQLAEAQLATNILAYIRHYGTFIIVCPHSNMLNSILGLRDEHNLISVNNAEVRIQRYNPHQFLRCIVVKSPRFDQESQDVVNTLRLTNLEYNFDMWNTIGSIFGRQFVNRNGRIYEYYVPTEDMITLRNNSIQNVTTFRPIVDGIELIYNVRLAEDRFTNFEFNIDLRTASRMASELNMLYDPRSGVRAIQNDVRVGENQYLRPNIPERGRPNLRGQRNRNRSNGREVRSRSRNLN